MGDFTATVSTFNLITGNNQSYDHNLSNAIMEKKQDYVIQSVIWVSFQVCDVKHAVILSFLSRNHICICFTISGFTGPQKNKINQINCIKMSSRLAALAVEDEDEFLPSLGGFLKELFLFSLSDTFFRIRRAEMFCSAVQDSRSSR